ncbi:MAG: ABC transporter substrate-binding protein [Rhodospirillaceae bacterium]|jgi:peptide/nickel transport system substrate-binding protein|nr:ABC transporter substrate-binding protein [Rhodospirillaceae bacterium]
MSSFRRMAIAGFSIFGLLTTVQASAETLRVGWPATAVTAAYPFARDDGGGLRGAIYDSLTWLNVKGVLSPRLALSWEIESANTWVFRLRENVVFSNGEPFNAETVVSALDIFYDPAVLHPRTADMGSIESYRARGPYELEITTSQPDPLLAKRLSQLPMIEPKAWADKGQDLYSKEPVGTGPYSVISWGGNNAQPVLEHVPTSWRPIGNITRIEVTVISDPGTRVSGMLSGQLDFIVSLASDDIPMMELAGFIVHKTDTPNILSIAFRTVRSDESPLTDARVRRAMNHAVDKGAISKYILGGLNQVAHQPALPGLIGYNPDAVPFDYNPEKAKALLADAGFSDGFPLKFAVYGGLLPGDTLIFQKMAQDLGAIGIETELQQVSFPDYVRRLFNGEWDGIDGFSIGWMNNALWDPQKSFEQFSCAYSAAFYCDEDMMPLIEAASTEMDPVAREQMLKDIVLAYTESAAALWLIDFAGASAYNAGIDVGDFRLDGTVYEQMTFKSPND